jgi:hypothetical protein
VPTELLVPSESLLIKFYNMNKMTLIIHLSKRKYKICTTVYAKVKLKHKVYALKYDGSGVCSALPYSAV